MSDKKKKGEMVITAQFRYPTDHLSEKDVEGAVESAKRSLEEAKMPPASVTGYAVEDVESGTSTGRTFRA